MSKVIIGIHGLGNKPPLHILKKWWEMSLEDGLKGINHPFPMNDFHLVYWANFIYSEPLDLQEKDKEQNRRLCKKESVIILKNSWINFY